MATLGMSAAERDAIETFQRDVVEPSMTHLVILDFWAEWCGPCKTLGPVLDKVAVTYADRGVKLVKIDVETNKLIAAQFRIQSIPTVYAMFQGKLVADLTPARTEAQLGQMLDQLLKQLPVTSAEAQQEQEIAPLIAMGEDILASGDAERALSIFDQLTDMAPEMSAIISGRARALIQLGRTDEAQAVLDPLTPEAAPEMAKDPLIMRAKAALAIAREAKPVDNLAQLIDEVKAHPEDLETRFQLAGGLMALGDHDAAADALLEIIGRDRDWNGGAARDRLLKLFEAVGLADPWVLAKRRRLSTLLFA